MKRWHSRGFTLIELVFILSIMGILVAIGLPAYHDYLERARLAEVMLGFDGMATAARVEAGSHERDLCHWPAQVDESTRRIKEIVDRDMALLDPAYWSTSTSGLNTLDPAKSSALVIQYAGVGEQGVRRSQLLAEMFQDNGLFNQWQQQTPTYSVFSVFLDHCKAKPAATTVMSAVTTVSSAGSKHGKPPANAKPGPAATPTPPATVNPPLAPAQPVIPVPSSVPGQVPHQAPPQIPALVPAPVASHPDPAGSAPSGQPPVQSSSSSSSASSLLSQAQQTGQCTTNCRQIWPHGNSNMYRNCVASCRP